MKDRTYEKEGINEESDVSIGFLDSIWVCSFSPNTQTNISTHKYLEEVKVIKMFMDDRTGKSLGPVLVEKAREE